MRAQLLLIGSIQPGCASTFRQQRMQVENNYKLLFRLQAEASFFPLSFSLSETTYLHTDGGTQLATFKLMSPCQPGIWMVLAELRLTWGVAKHLLLEMRNPATRARVWSGTVSELSLHHEKRLTKIQAGDIVILLKVEPTRKEQEMVHLRLQGRLESQQYDDRTNLSLVYQAHTFKKSWPLNPEENYFAIAQSFSFATLENASESIRLEQKDKIVGMVFLVGRESRLRNDRVSLVAFRESSRLISLPYVLKEGRVFPRLQLCIDMSISNGELGEGLSLHDGQYEEAIVGLLRFLYELGVQVDMYAFGVHGRKYVGPWEPKSVKELIADYYQLRKNPMASRCELVPLLFAITEREAPRLTLVLTDGDILDICKVYSECKEESLVFVGLGEGKFSLIKSLCDEGSWHLLRLRPGEHSPEMLKSQFLNLYFRTALQLRRQRRSSPIKIHSPQ